MRGDLVGQTPLTRSKDSRLTHCLKLVSSFQKIRISSLVACLRRCFTKLLTLKILLDLNSQVSYNNE
jgi:hypothetical protein